jgi:hypothetical protein
LYFIYQETEKETDFINMDEYSSSLELTLGPEVVIDLTDEDKTVHKDNSVVVEPVDQYTFDTLNFEDDEDDEDDLPLSQNVRRRLSVKDTVLPDDKCNLAPAAVVIKEQTELPSSDDYETGFTIMSIAPVSSLDVDQVQTILNAVVKTSNGQAVGEQHLLGDDCGATDQQQQSSDDQQHSVDIDHWGADPQQPLHDSVADDHLGGDDQQHLLDYQAPTSPVSIFLLLLFLVVYFFIVTERNDFSLPFNRT